MNRPGIARLRQQGIAGFCRRMAAAPDVDVVAAIARLSSSGNPGEQQATSQKDRLNYPVHATIIGGLSLSKGHSRSTVTCQKEMLDYKYKCVQHTDAAKYPPKHWDTYDQNFNRLLTLTVKCKRFLKLRSR